jgi:glycosyltransferase involved in cell wall biosynthesis
LLEEAGGSLTVLTGPEPLPFELPALVRVLRSQVPWRPPLQRALAEGRALTAEVGRAAAAGEPFDLVHSAHLPVPPKMPLAYSLLVHDLRSLSGEMAPFTRRLVARAVVGRAARGAALVITVSEAVRAELLTRFPLDPAGVVVVPNAADHFTPLARQAAADAPLVCLGHLEPRKNLELVLRALALDPRLPRLVLHGTPKHGEEGRLKALAQELGVAQRVSFAGPYGEEELPGLLAGAACVVLPSRLEGFGIVALEAQRAGVPLAVAAAGALPEVAGPRTPSFAPDDAAACARAIRGALGAGPADLEAARTRAEGYSWQGSAALLCAAWRLATVRARGAGPEPPRRPPMPRPGPRRPR